MLAQVVFRATELLGLISPPVGGLCANMIESTKVVIRGYGRETIAAKTNSPIARFLVFLVRVKLPATLVLVLSTSLTVFCMRYVAWTLNQIWRA